MRAALATNARWNEALGALAAAIAALGAACASAVPLDPLAAAQRHCNTAERLIEALKREHEATSEGALSILPGETDGPADD